LERRESAPRLRRGTYLIAAVVLATVLTLSIQLGAARGETEPAGEAEASTTRTELPDKRTATSDTYRLESGELQTEVFTAPVNYETEDGEFKPIDEELEETPDGSITNGTNSFELQLPEQMGEGAVQLSEEGDWLSYRLLGQETEAAEVEGATASYEAGNGSSFELHSLADGLKEEITLDNTLAPSLYRFALDFSAGLEPSLEKDGSIKVTDANHDLFATLPAPTISDSSGAPPTDAVHYSLQEGSEAGRWTLTVEADEAWLSDPERAWPVTIDPSAILATTEDCWLGGLPQPLGWHGCGNTGQTELLAGFNQSENQPSRTFLRFKLGSNISPVIPANAYVGKATLKLYAPKAAENTVPGLETRRVTQDWTTALNWEQFKTNNFLGPYKWTTPGGDFTSEGKAEVLTANRGSGAGWWNFESSSLRELVQSWVEHNSIFGLGSTNQGLVVKQIDETQSAECKSKGVCPSRLVTFNSSAAASNKPELDVTYFTKAPSTNKLLSPKEGTTTARRLMLKAGWALEGGVEYVRFQYRAGKKGPFNEIPSSLLRNGKGEAVEKFTVTESNCCVTEPLYFDAAHVNSELQSKGGQIQVRALFEGGSGAGYSEPVEAKVDRRLGGPKDATTQVGPGTLDLITGNLTLSATDVAIGGFNPLEFTRTYNTRVPGITGETTVLGQGWKPGAPVEEAGGSEWASVKLTKESEVIEGEEYAFEYASLKSIEGYEIPFEKDSEGNYVTPPELTGVSLVVSEGKFVLTDPDGNKTTFSNEKSGNENEYLPVSVTQPGSGPHSTVMTWNFEEGQRRLEKVVAPTSSRSPSECTESPTTTEGCRTLVFTYVPASNWGAPSGYGKRLEKITFYAPGEGGPWDVAKYAYESQGRLVSETDPRTGLGTTYTYEGEKLRKVTPPGQEPWTFEYTPNLDGETGQVSRLKSMKRSNLQSGETKTSIRYEVPLSGSGAQYQMSSSEVAKWGQEDIPTDATAVFPPTEVPAEPASSYEKATITYIDAEGFGVNTATPSGAGTSSPSISTAETDQFGNVTRELSAQNRLRALAAGSESAAKSRLLDTWRNYSPDGTAMEEEWGPLHSVQLESGEKAEARLHTVVRYDEGWPGTGTKPHLPTKELTEAYVPGGGDSIDQRESKTSYDWTLRKPVETITDAGTGHLNIKSKTSYSAFTGLPIEARQPKASEESGNVPGATKTIYYGELGDLDCYGGFTKWGGLPCKVKPAAQPSEGPAMPITWIKSYSPLGQPTEIVEETPGAGEAGIRKTILTYDAAGRQLTKKIEGGGVPVPKVETEYSPTLGAAVAQRFKCEAECEAPQFKTSIGYGSSSHGPLANPADVAVDASGNIWAVDKGNNRIVEYNEAGEFIREAGGLGSAGGKLSSPSGIAIDSAGNLDVTDTANNRVAQFSSTGAFIEVIGSNVNKTKVESGGTTLEKNRCTAASGNTCQAGSAGSGEGQIAEPIGITTTGGTNFFVVERANNRVEKLSPQAEVLAKFGETGSGNGQLKEPTAIGFHGFLLWVADSGNNRMEAFTTSYAYSRQFGKEGSGNGELKRPAAVDVDESGNVWVGDVGNNRVQKFSEAGGYLQKFGTGGSVEGQFAFSAPMGLALDSKGNVLVADPGNNRIEKWSTSGFDTQETKVTYDKLGRVETYEDADGGKAETKYDSFGRPSTMSDNKGSQTVHYDSVTGLVTELTDSAAGTFTASYDADGNLVKRGLPNGLTAETTYDPSGAPVGLTYTKSSNCGASCTWLQFSLERSTYGQILSESGTLGTDKFSYDRAGRLTEAQETPSGGSCTTRSYGYDKDSNRLAMTTVASTMGSGCGTGSSTEQKYSYDKADHLVDSGIVYDNFGRITKLPGADAGGKELTTGYFATNMVATQSQNGITNTFALDASLRQRQRLQAYGLEGTEVFHYDGASDSPAWTERGSTWTRNIAGIGGELAAIQESGKEITLQLTNLHGDVAATAAIKPEVTSLKGTFSYDEFGNPTSGSAGRFGWLGGKQRRTELPSGVIQMGVRSYAPQIGRFLSVDPVAGGSANAYDYVSQDPINSLDIGGEKEQHHACHSAEVGLNPSRVRNTHGTYNFKVQGFARCTRAARNVSVKIVVVGGIVRTPSGTPNITVPGETGQLYHCGNGGPRFSCKGSVETSVTARPACQEAWPVSLDVHVIIHWTTSRGNRKSLSADWTVASFVSTDCEE